MKTVEEIYAAYRIMPSLAMHQLRVAAVAKTICGNFDGELDEGSILAACLLHDMGNMIKSRLDVFPEFLEPEGKEYWQKIKDEFVQKYGNSSHEATLAIIKELGVSERIIFIVDTIGFSHMKETAAGDSFECKIAEYADSRTFPYGVTSLEERFKDAAIRYASRYASLEEAQKMYAENLKYALEIEQQIFARTRIAPEDITEESIQPLVEELRKYHIA